MVRGRIIDQVCGRENKSFAFTLDDLRGPFKYGRYGTKYDTVQGVN